MDMDLSAKTLNLQTSIKVADLNSVLHSEYVNRKKIGPIGQRPCIVCPMAKVCLSNNTQDPNARLSVALGIADLKLDSIQSRQCAPGKMRPLEEMSFMGHFNTQLTVMLETWTLATSMTSRMFQFPSFTEFVMWM